MEKYKVLQVCYDYDNEPPYFEELSCTSTVKSEAEVCMYACVIDELECLNGIGEDDTFPERRFIATTSGETYDVSVWAWDGPDYRPVSCYKVMTIDELVEFFNAKLRSIHGQDITVQIHSYEEDDGSIWFYYTSVKYGESDAYTTASAAYDEANTYLYGVGDLW